MSKTGGFSQVIAVRDNRCPPTCIACEAACSGRHGQPPGATGCIKPVHLSLVGYHQAIVCLQCNDPGCAEVCPTGAIARAKTGVLQFDSARCVGCRLCSVGCRYGGIRYPLAAQMPSKCDLCSGSPRCVDACEEGVLSLVGAGGVLRYMVATDPVPDTVSMCAGCAMELAIRFALRVLGRDSVVFFAPGCSAMSFIGAGVPTYQCLMTNVAATAAGAKRQFRRFGKDVKVVAIVGDGATADVGFQSLSGAAERNESILYICCDNEGYMNTGIQRSGSTPSGAWTTTSPVGAKRKGKEQPQKYLPLILALHGITYVATATVAFPEDYARKLAKAVAVKEGMAYIHVLVPCPLGWKTREDSAIEVSRAAVETDYFPLWEADKGKFSLTHRPKKPRPLSDFISMMGRFSHLSVNQLECLTRTTRDRLAIIQALCGMNNSRTKAREGNDEG